MNKQWIRLTKGRRGSVQIFCFPYSGGGAQAFQSIIPLLPAGIELYALEMPGRGRRFGDKLLSSVDELVQDALAGWEPRLEPRRTIFWGHSLGGIVAFEVIKELRRANRPLPKHLFVSAIRAPQVPQREETMYVLDDERFIEQVKDLEGTPDEILTNSEMLKILIPIIRKDFQAYETYTCDAGEPLECSITALGGKADRFVTSDDLEQWSQHTNCLFTKHIIDGGHFFIYDSPKRMVDIIMHVLTMQRPW